MPSKEQANSNEKASFKQWSPKHATENRYMPARKQAHPASIIQRARHDPRSLTSGDVLQLQRTIGNRASGQLLAGVAGRQSVQRAAGLASGHVLHQPNAVIQREITVQNIDFDPVADQFRHGFVRQQEFYQALRGAIWGDDRFNNYQGQWKNVIDEVSAQDYAQPDIDAVATAIGNAIRAGYGNRGLVLSNTLAGALNNHIRTALVANVQPDHNMAMDEQERGAFDQLAGIVGNNMSRAKGAPSQIPHGNLPQGIQGQVNAVLADIRAENALWTVAGLGPQYTLPNRDIFAQEILQRQRGLHYQGNHTNLAGWLPAVAVPVNQMTIVVDDIYAAASPDLQKRLTSDNALARIGLVGIGAGHPSRYRDEYNHLRGLRLGALGNAGLRAAIWAAMAQGVSAYIEFNMAGGMNRLVYDAVNNRVYITAHYKWRSGYNPFFQVTGFPAV